MVNAQFANADDNAALQLVSASKASLGLTAGDMNNVMVSSTYYDNATGIRMVYLQQTHKGIPVYNQLLVLAFKNNKLVSNAGSFNHSMEKSANVMSGMPSVSAESAVQSALSDRSLRPTQMAIALNRKDNGRYIEFSNMGVSHENITAQLIWSPVEKSNTYHLAWQVYIIPKATSDYWMVRVDAVDNRILGMDNYTAYDNWGHPEENKNIKYPAFLFANSPENVKENNSFLNFDKINTDPNTITTATYRVVPYPAESPIHPGGAHALRTDPWLAAPGNATTLKWNTGAAATDYDYSRGNNVWSYEDRGNANAGSVARSAASSTALPNLTFDFTPDYNADPTQNSPAPNQRFNITNLFYWNNIIHDIMYIYGLTEVNGNFQDDNQGRGGAGNDHVNAEAQDGSGSNNANFATPADGGSGRMQMYLWTGGSPQRDGDVDNGIIVHEYGHGISNRLTGGPAASGCLGNAEQMGEGWSDYYALMLTQDWSTATLNTGFNSPRGIGTYALFQPITGVGIRSQRYCTDFSINNKVYLASLPTSPHNRGEIWCATLWDMTWNIINQNGTINPNLYNLAGGGGNAIALRLVTEGLRLQQCSPGFISGRNAILQADQILYGGTYNCAIWEAFRRRGMGAFASEGLTTSVTDQIPDFTPPITLAAIVSAPTIPEGQNLVYTNSVATCSPLSGYTLRDTLPANVTYVSGGTYDAPNRIVSFAVNQAAGTTNYPFTVNVNPGSYFPPISLINEQVTGGTIPALWATSASPGTVWTVVSAQSHSAPNAFFVTNLATAGDQRLETTNPIALPANSYPKLSFWSSYNTEDGWDGGVVEISTNGGTTWTDLGPNMTSGGYNGALGAAPTNALSGRPAFTGLSAGFVNTIINLSAYAGQSVKLRFRFGSDDNTTAPTSPAGWWVDDITLDAIAAVNMRSSLFNGSNNRVFFKDLVTEITPVIACSPTITLQPVDASTCDNTSVTFTCTGTATGGVTYQWQLSTAGAGGPWNDLANGAPYSGVTTSTLTVNPAVVAMNGYQFRCVITGTCAPTNTSDAAVLTVAAASVGGTVTPANSQVCGTTNSGTLTLSGHIGSVLRWESATVLAGPYTAITNTSTTLNYTNLTQTTYFRAVVQFAGCAPVNSSTATVTFNAALALVIVADPGTTVCAGDPTRLTVMEGNLINANPASPTAGGNGQALVTFNIRNNNAFPVTFTGISSRCLTTGAMNARIFYKVTAIAGAPGAISVANGWNEFGNGASNSTAGAVHQVLSGLTLVIPAGTTYGIALEGRTAAGGANIAYTNGVGSVTYTDQNCSIITGTNVGYGGLPAPAAPTFTPRNFNGTVNLTGGSLSPVTTGTFLWSPAAGLSSTTTNPVAASPMATTTYTVLADDGAGCVRQASILITVNDRPAVTSQPANTTICTGSLATFAVGATGTGITYQWQESTNGGVSYTNLANTNPYSGVNTATLTVDPVTVVMNNNWYRCVISGVCTPPANSAGAILTVNALPTVSVTPTDGCGGVPGINGLLLTASGASSYTWSPLAGLFTNAIATTAYTGGNTPAVYAAPSTFTAYTVTGTNAATGCSNTATALINYTPPAPTVTPSSVAMCLGDPAVRLVSASAVPANCVVSSGAINIAVPDNTENGVQSVLTVSCVPAGAIVTGISVNLNMSHTYPGDMIFNLRAPNGQILNLYKYAGGSFTGPVSGVPTWGWYNASVSSNGTAAFNSVTAAPFIYGSSPVWRPDVLNAPVAGVTVQNPIGFVSAAPGFSALFSVPNGSWTLAMADGGPGDTGSLSGWSITINYLVGVPSTAATWSPVAGLFTDPAALNAYTGTPTDTVYAMPTPSGVYPYTATVQSVSLPPAEIATTFANNNAFALVTSNFTNNNAFPVTITGIESVASASGGSTARLYYKTSAINGAPGAISAANGWVLAGTGTYTAVANTTTTTPQPMLSGLSVAIPPGATYGIAFESQLTGGAGNLRYSTVAAGTYINSASGCDLTSGTNVSFAGDLAPIAPTFTPRAFIGKVLFSGSNAAPCTSPARTVVVTVNQPTSVTAQPVNRTICTDKLTTFVVTAGGTGPFSYQWQVSTNNGTTYNPVTNGGVYSGATTATLTITQPPVTMSGYFYRCVITGAAPCVSATSAQRTLTVNPLPTVIITAAPYTKLFPGLVTTISSTVTPNGAAPGGYTWLRNGAPVVGANSGTLSVDVDRLGDYRLTVTDVNGCTSTSNMVSITDSITGKCYIYPNPNTGQFQVRYYSAANNVLPRTLTVYDGKGDRVLTQMYTIGRPYDRMDVDMRKFGKGLYWVEIGDVNGNRLTMCRVVIQ